MASRRSVRRSKSKAHQYRHRASRTLVTATATIKRGRVSKRGVKVSRRKSVRKSRKGHRKPKRK